MKDTTVKGWGFSMGEESRSKTTPFTFGVPYGEEKQEDDCPNVIGG